jgi:AGZA family xanthine/uracil permease-like MFS transporter
MATSGERTSLLDRYFRISERGSHLGRELRGGLVTFVTVAYIIVLNPLIHGSTSPADPSAKRDVLGATLPVPQVAAVTALVAGVMAVLFGFIARVLLNVATGRARSVHPLLWGVAAAFVLHFVAGPISALVGG